MFTSSTGTPWCLHPFPTRRSSDLGVVNGSVARIDPSVQNGTVTVDVSLPAELPRGARPDLSVDGTIQLRSEEHTSELQSRRDLVCRLLLEKKKLSVACCTSGRGTF